MGNNLITMLKMTSLVTVFAAPDLLNRAQAISARNFYVFEMLIVATIWYLILTTVFTVIQQQIEKRVSRGFTAEQPSFRKRIRRVMSNSSDTQLISINEVEAKETLEK